MGKKNSISIKKNQFYKQKGDFGDGERDHKTSTPLILVKNTAVGKFAPPYEPTDWKKDILRQNCRPYK